jgi:hypothetical protein
MKLVKFLSGFALGLLCAGVYGFLGYLFNIETLLQAVLLSSLMIIIFMFIHREIKKKYNKELDSIKERYMRAGAKDLLWQMDRDKSQKEMLLMDVPIRNEKGEKYGASTVYSKISRSVSEYIPTETYYKSK